MYKAALIFTLSAFSICSHAAQEQEEYSKRIAAHLILKDPLSASAEAKRALSLFPNSKELLTASLQAHSVLGEERTCFETWKKITELFPEENENRVLLEALAWSVLKHSEDSKQILVSVNALMGISYTRDVKALGHIEKALKSSNALMRSIALRLAAQFGDAPLQEEILRLLKEEKVWFVKLEAVRAAGALKMERAAPLLKEILSDPKVSLEERGLAMIALVELFESIDKQELQTLLLSDRAVLRELGCEIVAHIDDKSFAPALFPLLKDSSDRVRTTALITLGLWRIQEKEIAAFLDESLAAVNPSVAITAAWYLSLLGEKRGAEALRQWMHHPDPRWAQLAAAAAVKAGSLCQQDCVEAMLRHPDSFVRVNCAWGLIGQRYQTSEACRVLKNVLEKDKKTLWMWDEHQHPLFDVVCKSTIPHIDQISDYPAVVDQMTRLRLLSALTVMRFPGTEKMVRNYLKNSNWIATSAASSTLLTEGDEESIECVRALIHDPDEKIRMQAALMLALIGNEPSALQTLEECYSKVDRDMKIRIVEAIVHIGDIQSVPFLLKILDEPFQTMRIIAAAGIIRCIYN